MAIQDVIASFVTAHIGLIQEIEKLALPELLSLLKSLYPQDAVLIAIVEKIAASLVPPTQ